MIPYRPLKFPDLAADLATRSLGLYGHFARFFDSPRCIKNFDRNDIVGIRQRGGEDGRRILVKD